MSEYMALAILMLLVFNITINIVQLGRSIVLGVKYTTTDYILPIFTKKHAKQTPIMGDKVDLVKSIRTISGKYHKPFTFIATYNGEPKNGLVKGLRVTAHVKQTDIYITVCCPHIMNDDVKFEYDNIYNFLCDWGEIIIIKN